MAQPDQSLQRRRQRHCYLRQVSHPRCFHPGERRDRGGCFHCQRCAYPSRLQGSPDCHLVTMRRKIFSSVPSLMRRASPVSRNTHRSLTDELSRSLARLHRTRISLPSGVQHGISWSKSPEVSRRMLAGSTLPSPGAGMTKSWLNFSKRPRPSRRYQIVEMVRRRKRSSSSRFFFSVSSRGLRPVSTCHHL